MRDDRAALPSAARGGGSATLVLACVWLLGVVGPMARARTVVASLVVGVASVAVICLLGRRRPILIEAVAALALVVAVGLAASRGVLYPLAVAVLGTTLAFGAMVRWSLVPRWPQRAASVAGPAIGVLVVAELSWLRRGSAPVFLALSLACCVVLEVYARCHGVAARIDGAVARVAHVVAAAITAALSAVVVVVFVVPVSILSRLVRYSPLDGGWATASTAWVPVDRRRVRRADGAPAAPERMSVLEPRASRSMRRRGHARLLFPAAVVVVVAIATLGTSSVGPLSIGPWTFGADGSERASDQAGTITRKFEDDAAFADAPWAKDLRLDLLDAWSNLEFNAAVGGWQIKDITSDGINVTDGERASTMPDEALGEPVDVWFMGASAAFGAGQRDDQTIASDLVRLAGADGVPVRMHNLAVPATVDWQTAMLLVARLQWDDPPDLIVVYDGANDLALQEDLARRGRGRSDEPASLVDGELDKILSERSKKAGADLPPVDTTVPDEPLEPAESGALVGRRYGRGVSVMRSAAAAAGVPIEVFWQPEIRTKQPLTDVDRSTMASVGVDPSSLDDYVEYSAAARRSAAAGGVIDLSGAFDGHDEPIYWDTVHTNELGASLVAAAMYRSLGPMLRELHRSSDGG